MKKKVCLYFQMHQPLRMRPFTFFDIGKDARYEDDELNKSVLQKVVDKCYLPTTLLIQKLLASYEDFKVAFSVSGILFEQLKNYHPEIIELFKELLKTGRVELLAETYYHSLACLRSKKEFIYQIKKHVDFIESEFNVHPVTFRNTELIYNNDVAKIAKELGFKVVLGEGTHIYHHGPNYVFKPKDVDIKLLLRNYPLADDIAFRFSQKMWKDYPLTPKKYVDKLLKVKGNIINIFIDYETFGEHHFEESSIFKFLEELPLAVKEANFGFINPKEVIGQESFHEIDMPMYTSWADKSKDLSAWLSNDMQRSALDMAYLMEDRLTEDLLKKWRNLLASDHLYYMSTKDLGDGAVHNYFSPYSSPYEAYVIYTNILKDLLLKI